MSCELATSRRGEGRLSRTRAFNSAGWSHLDSIRHAHSFAVKSLSHPSPPRHDSRHELQFWSLPSPSRKGRSWKSPLATPPSKPLESNPPAPSDAPRFPYSPVHLTHNSTASSTLLTRSCPSWLAAKLVARTWLALLR
jgi:hypothetical protein